MSITAIEFQRRRRAQSNFYYKLVNVHPLTKQALSWLEDHNKQYHPETLAKFNVQEATLQCFDRRAATESRGFVWADPVITFPAGPIHRAYRYLQPDKNVRWRCVPTGEDAQWLGDLSLNEVIVCEGEWDCFRLQDVGFGNAVTHTAGAGTWLPKWTPVFAGKKVFICFDRDRVGQQGAAKVAQNIFPVATEVRLVDLPLPGTADLNDVSDFFRVFRGGGAVDEFRKLLRNARLYIPAVRATGRGSGLHRGRVHGNGSRLVSN
jgi:hypothetical protein